MTKEKCFQQKRIFFKLGTNRLETYHCGAVKEINDYFEGSISGCAQSAVDWILLYSNMDYLRCPDKVSINGKHSCR